MKVLRLLLSFMALLAGMPVAWAQVVTTQPTFFRDTDAVTLTFDASQGNRALANFTGDVYVHTGVITNRSTTPSDWKYVKFTNFNAPDPSIKLTRSTTNPNLYTISLTPSVRAWYNVPAGEQILKLAMVFRNATGSLVGRATGGGDIFVDVAQGSLTARITSPAVSGTQFVAAGTAISVTGQASASADLKFLLNGTQVAQQAAATTLTSTVTINQTGRNVLRFTATSGATTASDSLVYVVRPAVTVAALPAGAKDGVTYINGGTSVILNLTAPGKQFVYAIGEFNNWQARENAYMNRTPDGKNWWVQINNLTPGQEYAYQYLVDGSLRVADPYTEKVLDPGNDSFIPAITYPNLKAYPTGQTTGIVSVLQTNQTAYQWQINNFSKPSRSDLVIYELHLRDFIARHDYQTLRDTLAYIQRLGINCIELMPVNEFEGNESWGYNTSFHFAPDKYYGPKNELKRFIDDAHRRGIAVVLDMVLNHAFGQNPMVQMYFDAAAEKPAANSPWFNADATHPFNVGYDFNHESADTRYYSKRVIEHWLREYHIDGYRFDLSKGFTQRNTPTNVTAWGAYDQSRINIWQDYYSYMVSVDPTVYPILEHFADNSEEIVLSNMGFMLWGNMNHQYNQATMGYNDQWDFSGGYYGARTWTRPNLVTYMESHDEERLMFKNLSFGNVSGSYSVKNLTTALARQEMAAAFFFTVPGPKMVWQFGELGYDVSIDENGRVGNKPIRWNYQQVAARRKLYDVYRYLIGLKKTEPAFENPTAYTQNLSGAGKTIHLTGANLSVTVVGNFDVVPTSVNPEFQRTGKWYNYLTGDSITIANATAPLTLQPGEYAVYTSRKIAQPTTVLGTKRQREAALQLVALPNPAGTTATLRYELTQAAPVTVTITNMLGATVRTIAPTGRQGVGGHEVQVPVQQLANGIYMVRLSTGSQQQTVRLSVQH
ncbi:alpha-amylase family glycosyl hydrolase [Hymenobacter mucosus]|uniref:Por secretion system C-terminal sorting domain-containing protein n=1 Tax=Hymenobacter mucosus TaxID=1411120 RepID=A0A238VHY4_9BACT|nr:alpha-amylase family glycosyl hydrolase [Hymenobacter mucosus]SNR33846.1 Por secretion system C-terminal sorting domain-containing protein [Hymenobacter mucosus]